MKRWLTPFRQGLRRQGWDVVRYNAQTSVQARRANLLRHLQIACVLDIGANVGEYAAGLRGSGYAGEILSIEPTRDAYAALEMRRQRDRQWTARRAAVAGCAGQRRIFVAANSVSSSLLERAARLVATCPESRYIGEETVAAVTLDALLDEVGASRRPVWAKLDVQGSEGEILAAGHGGLRRLRAIEIELPLVEMYAGEGLWLPVLERVQRDGFELVSLESNTFDARGAVLEVNAMLVRSDGWRDSAA